MICKRCRVTGRVQGVWFRDSTRTQALRLGVSGSAVNLADGSVEVLACGEAEAVDALCEWLWRGPEMSQVSGVTCDEVIVTPPSGFVIG